MQNRPAAQDLSAALRALANRLTLKARDAAAESKRKDAADPQAEFLRGVAEGYYKAALELASVLKEHSRPAAQAGTAAPAVAPSAPPVEGSAPPPPAAEPAYDTSMHLSDVMRMLEYGGATPRDVVPYKDGTYHATFSKWQNMTDGERLEKVKRIDSRIIILSHGRTKESNDPFIAFAFQK
jgi:hypothetical protein